jgi:glycosyltransferase involved in cell wall biosynthesis
MTLVKILHVITTLVQGGAEAVLFRLIVASTPALEHVVVSMSGDAYYVPKLRSAGIEVHTLNMPRGRLTLSGLLRLRRLIIDPRPDVVQTWMYHADLVGGLIARWAGVPVVWGVRNSNLDTNTSSVSARIVARVCGLISGWLPDAIICCSAKAARIHQVIGYCAEKFAIIPNGVDITRFAPDAAVRMRTRMAWGIQPDQRLVGMVARWDPQKDHDTLLHALTHLTNRGVIFRFVLVGTGMSQDNAELCGIIDRLGLRDRMILAGPHEDIPAVMNAIDLHVLSSAYGEAFPSVVAEAMACGTPSVVTDVGDSAQIVGTTGWVVPPKDAEALAQGIQDALITLDASGREVLGQVTRTRVQERYGLKRMVDAYVALWKSVANVKM